MADWEVDFFIVATTTKDAHTDTVYANGVMQIPVVATLGAIDKKTSKAYALQDSDLDKIELYDFKNPDAPLDPSWFYTNTRNPLFCNSLGIAAAKTTDPPVEASPARAQVLGATNPTFRSKTFWVSATVVETKFLGARIKQPDNTTFTTEYSVYNKNVKLTATEPVVYTTDNVDVAREDTGNGNYNYYVQDEDEGNWSVSAKPFDQDNYYVSSKLHPFVHADIHGRDVTGFGDGHPEDWRLANCYGYYPTGEHLMLSFIWDFGVETTTTAGLFKQDTVGDAGRAVDAFVNMRINKRSNAVCLTRLAIESPDPTIWGNGWEIDNSGFTVYDIYGNTGKFLAGFSKNHNLVTVTNAT